MRAKILFFLTTCIVISSAFISCESQSELLTIADQSTPVIQTSSDTISVTRVAYQEGRVKAFTDITFFDNQFFLVFRESDKHAYGEDGVVHIFNSSDGEEWNFMKEIKIEGIDLRDPNFAISGNELSMYVHGSTYDNQTIIKFNDYRIRYSDSTGWQESEEVYLDNTANTSNNIEGNEAWPWRMTWHNNKMYTIGYNGSDIFDVYTSQDGLNFTKQNAIEELPDLPTEARVRVNDNGEFFTIVRRLTGSTLVGRTFNPESDWNWDAEIPFENFRGPNFLPLQDDKLLFTGGFYSWVYLGVYDLNTNITKHLIDIPSFGDGSYPGMLIKNNILWLSYYTSFENEVGSSVYVAKINLNYFQL